MSAWGVSAGAERVSVGACRRLGESVSKTDLLRPEEKRGERDDRSSSTPTRPYADPPTRFLLAFAFFVGEDDAQRHL